MVLRMLSASSFHLNKDQPSSARQATTNPITAEKFNNRNRARPDAEASQQKSRHPRGPLN